MIILNQRDAGYLEWSGMGYVSHRIQAYDFRNPLTSEQVFHMAASGMFHRLVVCRDGEFPVRLETAGDFSKFLSEGYNGMLTKIYHEHLE